MTTGTTIAHTAIKVKDINGMTVLLQDLLGFHVRTRSGDGEIPSNVWFEEGLQLVHDPDFEGPEGRLHHLGVLVSDLDGLAQECESRGYAEVRPKWYVLPDGLLLEFIAQEGS